MTNVPAALAAIASVFDAATTVPVIRGASLAATLPAQYVMVGVSDSGPAVRVSRLREEGMHRHRYRESWTVGCLMVTASGGSDLAALATSTGSLLSTLDAALRAATGSAWQYAGVEGDMRWGEIHTTDGAQVGVFFEVHGWAWV